MRKHPHPTPILFFKIIPGTSLADGKLKIPKIFTRKYGGDLSNPIFLKPPDGTEWELFWTKHDDDVWLQKGWKEFATYYCLDHGHMVLFEYMQTSHFKVHIFDKSTLEIDYPLHVCQDVQDNLDQISDDDSVQILDEIPPCHKTREKSPMSSPQPCKKSRTGTSGDVKGRSTEQNLPQHVQTEGTNFEKSKFASVKKESDESVQGEGINWLDPQRVVDVENKTVVTRKGEKATPCPFTNGALKEANKFASENPFFTVNINSGIRPHVPRAFATEYFNNKTQIVKLQFGKKLWPVKLFCYRPNSSSMFSSGWFPFARESELVGGDVCVFELINREDAVIDVHIFRGKGDEPTQRSSPLNTPCLITNGVLKEENKFASKNPSFAINITPRYLETQRPRVPLAFLEEYFKNKTQNVMLQFENKLWPVKLLCYPHNNCGILSSGWSQFAGESELVGGEVCVFELINREYAVLEVHIFRGHY